MKLAVVPWRIPPLQRELSDERDHTRDAASGGSRLDGKEDLEPGFFFTVFCWMCKYVRGLVGCWAGHGGSCSVLGRQHLGTLKADRKHGSGWAVDAALSAGASLSFLQVSRMYFPEWVSWCWWWSSRGCCWVALRSRQWPATGEPSEEVGRGGGNFWGEVLEVGTWWPQGREAVGHFQRRKSQTTHLPLQALSEMSWFKLILYKSPK